MTNVEKLREIGAGVLNIIEGTEYYSDNRSSTARILITAIGRETFLGVWDYDCTDNFAGDECGSITLMHRDWKVVDFLKY